MILLITPIVVVCSSWRFPRDWRKGVAGRNPITASADVLYRWRTGELDMIPIPIAIVCAVPKFGLWKATRTRD
jgi:hypothetical protein